MTALSVHQISKNYGAIAALKNVSFDVPQGSIFGILGPNGSGKTTLLGIVTNVLKANAGTCSLFGEPITSKLRRQTGTLLETPNFYHYLSARKNLEITAQIKGYDFSTIDDVLKRVDLYERKDSKFSTFSLGMKQRLAIAAALLGSPSILILDEPTNGLDPNGIADIRSLIKSLANEGKTVVMASHLLDEVEKVCTHVAILKKGTLLADGNVNSVLKSNDIIELSAPDFTKLKEVLSNFTGYTSMEEQRDLLLLHHEPDAISLEALNKYCFEHGVTLTHLSVHKKSLETKFLEITNQ
ncbi:ABC transporter ATP-binding protein [Arachidicoccus ginsenosidimutans]|uniref:ABC transporter ATP-binding protein n=1 Tax=Arachidicoccus sp. BS20 TaxID=1850526 RepID=UPI0007F0FDF4|nr:ABC transporter ATP-binding protein [Arachidicoccus sp. BS20]ANI88750.1 ABC transporter ATP-binding protein [Arachidicoccus sp. BS20]